MPSHRSQRLEGQSASSLIVLAVVHSHSVTKIQSVIKWFEEPVQHSISVLLFLHLHRHTDLEVCCSSDVPLLRLQVVEDQIQIRFSFCRQVPNSPEPEGTSQPQVVFTVVQPLHASLFLLQGPTCRRPSGTWPVATTLSTTVTCGARCSPWTCSTLASNRRES